MKRIGFPLDVTVGELMSWRIKNKLTNNQRIITPDEVIKQTKWTYVKDYKGDGCEESIKKQL